MTRRTTSIFMLALAMIVATAGSPELPKKVRAATFFGAQRFPAIDVDSSDKLYLMMSTATAPAGEHRPHSQIFFTMSRDGGNSWDNFPETRNLSNSRGEAFGPSLAVNKNGTTRAYVTYHDDSNGPTQAYLIRSKKKAKFRGPVNITPHNGGALSPRVALDSGEGVNIVWGDVRDGAVKVVFVRSTDQGSTFSDPVDVSKSHGVAIDPEIAVDPSDAINVVWQDSGSGKNVIMFSRSTDRGQTFSQPKQVSNGTGSAAEASIAADSRGRLNVAWVDDSTGNSEAFYSHSTDSGQSFSDAINVSNFRTGEIHKPVVTTFGDKVYVAFQNGGLFGEDSVRNMQVFLTTSTDAGRRFGEPEQVSHADNNRGRAHSPAMVVDSQGVLHIAWIDASIVGNDEGLLFYSHTNRNGGFSPQQMILAVIVT